MINSISNSIPSNFVAVAQEALDARLNTGNIAVATHNGKFHADEVFACALLKVAAESKGVPFRVVRTRDQVAIDLADIRVDVGGKCEFDGLSFDHHQRDFSHNYIVNGETRVPMASCGLIWTVVSKFFTTDPWIEEQMVNWLFQIDATDVGHPELLGDSQATSMAGVIALLNSSTPGNNFMQQGAFESAVRLAVRLIMSKLSALTEQLAMESSLRLDASLAVAGVMTLTRPGPWIEYVLRNIDDFQRVKVCVFESTPGDWRVQTLPASAEDRFSQRCSAPEAWRGLRGDDLVKVCGVTGATFVHAGGFIGGATSKEAAIDLANVWVHNSTV